MIAAISTLLPLNKYIMIDQPFYINKRTVLLILNSQEGQTQE